MIDNIQKPREQKGVSKRSKSRINTGNIIKVTSLALSLLLPMSGTTKLQDSLTTKCGELTEGMKELGSKAVDTMLVGLEKTVDAIGPTNAYAEGNPDDDFLDGELSKSRKQKKDSEKQIKEVQEKRIHIEKVDAALKYVDSIVTKKIPLNMSTKKKWKGKYKIDIEKNMFVYEQDMQMKFREMIRLVDDILKYAK